MRWILAIVVACALVACGDDGPSCPTGDAFPAGSTDGHPAPLGAGPGEARAGRVSEADLPVVPSGLATWKPGDFVLANDRVALVIEDVGHSDLYDPWGGRPVGLARVEGGQMVQPNNFGEMFLLTGRSTVVTTSVSVVADGSDGGAAIVRVKGKLHPMPFLEALISVVFSDAYDDLEAAIDYSLAPGAEHVDVTYRYASPREKPEDVPSVLHALMYTKRTPVFLPGVGFTDQVSGAKYLALVDDAATSWAYVPGDGGTLGTSLAVSGFLGAFSQGYQLAACGTTERLHAKIVIGGPGADGIQAATARVLGESQRAITGSVMRGGAGVAGIHVHAVAATGTGYHSRTTTDASGAFTVHVPATADVRIDAVAPGEPITSAMAGTASGPVQLQLPARGAIRVTASDGTRAVPARVQVLATGGPTPTPAPDKYGEPSLPAGRLHVAYAVTGDVTLPVPPGSWEVIVSRGYEYEVVRQTVNVAADDIATVDAVLDHSVATPTDQCGDFHIHTWRSNDSGDDSLAKVSQAVADGLELPVRSEHEYVADFTPEIAALRVESFAASMGSIELTSMEVWGHMGVFPLTPDPDAPNAGAPRWQTYPTADEPDTAFATLSPVAVFDAVRARPEAPIVIINHPRGGANYFDYVGFNAATGIADNADEWDTKFTLVEVFNDSDWLANRDGTVADWFGLLRAGRKVFAVGSSDSHALSSSPVGYPRTCIALGTDDPRQPTPSQVRDQLAAGHATISGGIYVTATLGGASPGDTTTGAGNPLEVDVVVRAATWIDVDAIDVVVDGTTVDTIPIMPGDADPQDPAVRWRGKLPVQTAATGGFVVIAAYGDRAMEPVHPGRKPFGVTNPIFVAP